MFSSRQCSKSGCSRPAAATLTFVYADSQAVLGPLADTAEPGAYDLCRDHADNFTVPKGWEIIRLPDWRNAPVQSDDDLLALANAVREAAQDYDSQNQKPKPAKPSHIVELGRHGHLTVLADDSIRR